MSEVENAEATVEKEVEEVLPKLAKISSMTPDQLMELRPTPLAHIEERRKVEKHIGTLGAGDALERGVLYWMVGRSNDAAEALESCASDPLGSVILAKAYEETRRPAKALEVLAKKAPGAKDTVAKRIQLECLARVNNFEDLGSELDSLEKEWKDRDEFFYFKGLIAENEGNYDDAEDLYEKALSLNPDNIDAMFRLAYRLDMRGEDEMAMEFYERCTRATPPHLNAFMNLGVMYEDAGKYPEAVECFKRVLQFDGTHARARLFLKDAEASIHMHYDEDEEKKEDRLNQILRIPVTDFELSVRSRNCLEKMSLRTLGDLIKMTEPELLAFKNFGETSLAEIKEILASKGLRLGMARELDADAEAKKARPATGGGDAPSGDVTSHPISELELSVRSRRAMAVLGIQTIGDLAERSEEDLRGVKNFGQTSLNEIKRKLEEFGQSLS